MHMWWLSRDSGTAETQFYDQPVEDAQARSAQQTEHDTPRSTTDSNQLAHELHNVVHTVEVHATLDSLQYAKLDCEQMKAEEKYDTALPSAISSEEPAANFEKLMPTYAVVDKSKRSREIGNDTYVDIKETIPVLDSAIDNIAEYVNSATMLHPTDTQPPDHTRSDQEDSEPISYYAMVNKKKKKSIPSKPPASSGVYTNLTSMKWGSREHIALIINSCTTTFVHV